MIAFPPPFFGIITYFGSLLISIYRLHVRVHIKGELRPITEIMSYPEQHLNIFNSDIGGSADRKGAQKPAEDALVRVGFITDYGLKYLIPL